jgi:predicted secreted hydrolase
MKRCLAIIVWAAADCLAQDWRTATLGWQYEFPRDHHAHPEFRTEWWYFTGNLFDQTGRRFGYELTFFREGVIPPSQRTPARSRFVVDDLKFAHFTITDPIARKFRFDQKTSRGAFAEAGFDRVDEIAWIENWSLKLNSAGQFRLSAAARDANIELVLLPENAPVIHGNHGVSLKASGENHASHYYSITRLTSHGTIRVGRKAFNVTGISWFDHEWATNQLAPNQVGWNWLCVQFTNRTELMLYQMRLDDGTIDPVSSGTFVDANGNATHLTSRNFTMTSVARWKSVKTNTDYPIEWTIDVPSRELSFTVRPILRDQELALVPLAYWEGAIDVFGNVQDKGIRGVGYLELTGYAGPLRELAR